MPRRWAGTRRIPVHRFAIRFFCFISLFVAASIALAQTEFSADIVETGKTEVSQGKIYVGDGKMRFESADKGDPRRSGVFIMDMNTSTAQVLMPQQHMYMEMPGESMENRGMYGFFRSGDVENACADWLKLKRNQGATCQKVGDEPVSGRSTVKYEGTNTHGEKSTVWLDSKLRFPVKWQDSKNGGEMRNVQEGSQPASLFAIPAGYTKMDIGSMMRQPQ
jgi:hypothetical protein